MLHEAAKCLPDAYEAGPWGDLIPEGVTDLGRSERQFALVKL